MFSLHCREGVTGWRCLHSSPFNSRCVSCTRVLSAWRGRRVPPWAFLWMLRVQSREHGVESLWPRERWGDKVCPSQPICISPTGSQGARLPHLITQGTAFRHQCDSGTFEVLDTGNPTCQWPSGPRGCEPWVLRASTTGSDGQRKPLPAEALGRECASGREAARHGPAGRGARSLRRPLGILLGTDPHPRRCVCGRWARGCVSMLSFPQVTPSSG